MSGKTCAELTTTSQAGDSKNRTSMKKHHRARYHRRRFSHYVGRQGTIHASQALPAVLVAFYQSLVRQDPELAEQFRRDPLGLKTGRGEA